MIVVSGRSVTQAGFLHLQLGVRSSWDYGFVFVTFKDDEKAGESVCDGDCYKVTVRNGRTKPRAVSRVLFAFR